MTMPIAHLRVHSDYSLGRGASKVDALVKRAAKFGMPAMALTDDLNLHGALQIAKYAEKEGLQAITGATIHIPVGKDGLKGSMILLAQDDRGYANICRLVNMALRPGRRHEGVLDGDMIGEVFKEVRAGKGSTDGIVALAGCGADGVVGRIASALGADKAKEMLGFLARLFPGRLYVEICRNGYPTEPEAKAERATLEAARDLNLPIVGTCDVWYADPGRHEAYEILKAVADGERGAVTFDDEGGVFPSPRRYDLCSPDTFCHLFEDLPEAVAHTLVVAQRCAFVAKGRKPILPSFESPSGLSEDQEIKLQSESGLEMRLDALELDEGSRGPYRERLAFELGVIAKMGFSGYFLIVSDFIKWAKSQSIPVGPGRGSGAGSVAAWALAITDLDPIRFGLLFERFLNPDRVSMPDFDVDFCQTRREEVIEYVRGRYGDERVSQIVTFSEIKSKTAIKDAARVVKHSVAGALGQIQINELSQIIPKSKEKPAEDEKLAVAYDIASEFREKVDASDASRAVFNAATKIEGLYRNSSAHAAGVIIAGDVLTNLAPIGFDPKSGMPVAQFNMKDVETVGLVKFDFLGLKTLTVIEEAVRNVEATTGKRLDISRLRLDDKPTFDMLSKGLGTGVFQLESAGMKKVLKDLKPTVFEDLIAVVSLYRPGPMDLIPNYVNCKNHGAEPDYPEPREHTEPVLKETFGIMVYQEQVMSVARAVAGYSLGQADLLRRAMGKKIKAEMDAQKAGFVEGAVANGVPAKTAGNLFDLIAKFADYGFNKSHAAAYALLTYQTAWLKCHYPVEFFAALMTYENVIATMDLVKQDMDAFKIALLPPCVNASEGRFKPERQADGTLAVRFGLRAVKSISDRVEEMVAEREKGGPFADLEGFQSRVGKLFNAGAIDKLAESGAFDALVTIRNRHRAAEIVKFLAKNDKSLGGNDLFGGEAKIVIPKAMDEIVEWADYERREFDSVGFYFRQHPLDRYLPELIERGIRRRASIVEYMTSRRMASWEGRKVCGMVEQIEKKTGRKGQFYISVQISERDDRYWVSIYESQLKDMSALQTMLEASKVARKPVVAVVRLGMGSQGNGYYLSANEIYDAQSFIDSIVIPRTLKVVIKPQHAFSQFSALPRLNEISPRLREIEAIPTEERSKDQNDEMGDLLAHVAEISLERMKLVLDTRGVADEKAGDFIETLIGMDLGKEYVEIEVPSEKRYRICDKALGEIKSIPGLVKAEYEQRKAA